MNSVEVIWILLAVSFALYFVLSMVYKKLNVRNLEQGLITINGLRLLNIKHLIGIVLFGILFFVLIPELHYLITLIEIPRLLLLIIILIIMFLSVYISKLAVQKHVVQHRPGSHYGFSDLWSYLIIRFAFLFSYEYFFRGVILFKFLEFSTLFQAVLYSTILYVFIHIFDSKKEILGAIPFGFALCLITYYTNSIWYAFFIHLALSAVYEVSIFHYQTLKTSKL